MTTFTRFAPSPSGYLHLGHAFSALFAMKIAAVSGGKFFLRIEDIDRDRCRLNFEKAIYEDLRWLGVSWEPEVYRQSERLSVYKEAIQKLDSIGMLYPCFCSRKEILEEYANINLAPHLSSQNTNNRIYPGKCRKLNKRTVQKKINNGAEYSLRLKMDKAISHCGPLFWYDVKRGPQKAEPETFGDIVIARKDIPTSYHLAVTLDDHAQSINQVTRGEDLFQATHIHRLLQCLLKLNSPQYFHHDLIYDSFGKKFSKRDNSCTLRQLRQEGKSQSHVKELIKIYREVKN